MRRGICLLLLVACLLCAFGCKGEPPAADQLEIYCLDVGQGAATLLRTEAGDVLVDCGSEDSQERLCYRLQALGVTTLQCLILTHFDEDHIGGADGVLEGFAVEALWVSGVWEESEASDRLWAAARAQALVPVSPRIGEQCRLGDAVLTVLAPLDAEATGNRASLVLTLKYRDFSMLLMGDAGSETEAQLLQAYGAAQLQSDCLLVAHHGANSSCSESFLQTVAPKSAFISCGAGNSYGHPDGRTLARLKSAGAAVYRTDLSGELHIAVGADGYQIQS